ncbi:ferroptosis suppressor protein 1-like [Clavelina lepadiformis]|uniref:ferroptosis suppressor protein 1-like n=1 Tax=Clavelina lepadiformis TaxID=159417 RepID=UPI004041EBAF
MGSGGSTQLRDENKHIVVVGGGYGGSYLAFLLRKKNHCKVTLIDPKDAMIHSVGALRTAVDKTYSKKLFLPYGKMLGDTFIQGSVVNLNSKNKTLTLADGKTITYTHLVIATGSNTPFPAKVNDLDPPALKAEESLKIFDDFRNELIASKKIVLVGGGAVGVELAGEIKTDYPDKEVTIINSRDFLISSRAKPAFQKKLAQALRQKKITVLLNERVSNLDEVTVNKNVTGQVIKTEGGQTIECDMIIPCTGTKINNHFFKEELADAINDFGALCVNENLQVKGHDDIFALGDVTDIPEEKMAYVAKMHAAVLAHNLTATKRKLKTYKTGPLGIVVPIGRDGGVAEFKGMIMGNFLVKTMKSKDLFADMMWSDLGLKPPK